MEKYLAYIHLPVRPLDLEIVGLEAWNLVYRRFLGPQSQPQRLALPTRSWCGEIAHGVRSVCTLIRYRSGGRFSCTQNSKTKLTKYNISVIAPRGNLPLAFGKRSPRKNKLRISKCHLLLSARCMLNSGKRKWYCHRCRHYRRRQKQIRGYCIPKKKGSEHEGSINNVGTEHHAFKSRTQFVTSRSLLCKASMFQWVCGSRLSALVGSH